MFIPINEPSERTDEYFKWEKPTPEDIAMFTNRFWDLVRKTIPAEQRICELIKEKITGKPPMTVIEIVDSLYHQWKTHKNGGENVGSLSKQEYAETIKKCIEEYGRQIGLKVEADTEKVIKEDIPLSGISEQILIYSHHQRRINFPPFRVVVTNKCNLKCEYCPPDNENYAGNRKDIDLQKTETILAEACEMGFQKFCFTGGEPFCHDAFIKTSFLNNFADKHPKTFISLSTNGTLLTEETLDNLSKIKHLVLKVSLDTLEPEKYNRICGGDYCNHVKDIIDKATNKGIITGINFVLRKENAGEIREILDFARSHKSYLKILDLNWYEDIGKRNGNNHCYGDKYWKKHYCSPDEAKHIVQDEVGVLRRVPSFYGGYGIPLLETANKDGFFVRIKDWREGTHYSSSDDCPLCYYFRNRKCQEGLYQLTLTSELKLKICRHRSNLAVDLSQNEGGIKDKIQKVLKNHFYTAKIL